MYSREKRMRAIELYIKYEKSPADVIRELGYPDRKMLGKWYKMYLEEQETGVPYKKGKIEIQNPPCSLVWIYIFNILLCKDTG